MTLSICNCFHFNDVRETCPTRIPLFPGVTLAFALLISNLLTNYRLQHAAWGWPEWRQLLVRRRL
jgi:hypothetical protein